MAIIDFCSKANKGCGESEIEGCNAVMWWDDFGNTTQGDGAYSSRLSANPQTR